MLSTLESGIENWGRVPALGCEPTFISDLADAVIESLPYVGAMAVSNPEARQSLVPLGSVEELLVAYDSQHRECHHQYWCGNGNGQGVLKLGMEEQL
ncbi:putative protoporphyrin ferrochelatase [Medicago truncatula]|uniref:Ferrochelatase n=1 Tax=Medicago truncatula TaxID=3880 RepID=G7JPM9_MEDTR|nr:ferrochelatase-2, chloroplastic [Medicago truncatula]AES90304.2 ferrochelatase [Medicago truncatula]RHN62295.1 putative protoporphyrin ferrochelatase [Medicago truncatula]